MVDGRGFGRFSAAGILLAVLLAVPRAATFAAVLGKDPVGETFIVRSPGEALRLLEGALPPAGGRMLLLSQYTYMAGMVLPLRDKGLLKELSVVLPSGKRLGPDALDGIRLSLAAEGIPPSELDGATFDNGVVRGALRGVPFSYCALPGIPSGRGPYSVVIDTFFLFGVYRSEASMPMIDLAGKLFVTLRARGVEATSVLVLDGTPRADFPLEHGELAMLIREMASSPSGFADALPEKWRLRKDADLLDFFLQGEEASGLYRRWNGIEPGDGSAAYRIARIAAGGLDADTALFWIDRAASADSAFRRGYPDIAAVFRGKGRWEAAERVLRAGVAKFPGDPVLATALAGLFVALGDGASRRGKAGEAEEYYRMAATLEGADPGVREEAESRRNPSPRRREGGAGGNP